MSEKDWWSNYGSFTRWRECPTRPDPAAVLLFYLRKLDIKPEEQIDYLMDLLDLQKSMVYNILKGEGFDSISRCRQLVQALKIHPPLLGIDAKYYPIERHACWWQAYGFFFNADVQGYPVMSEVIAHLREQRTQTHKGGRVKVWSQEDLGDACGLKKETIYRMEHEKNPLILESMSRRAVVASALGNLSGENEHTLFRLFGLDPQAYRVPVPAHEVIWDVHFSPKKLTDKTLSGYHRKLGEHFTIYYTHHGEDTVPEALEWVRQLPTLMPLANTSAQRVNVLALQSRNHRFLLEVAREQVNKASIVFHANKAVKCAEQVMTLPNPKLSCDRALLVIGHELLASALLSQAIANYELAEYALAQERVDRALNLLSALQSNQLKKELLAGAGLIHAYTATTVADRTLVLAYFNQAVQIVSQPQFPSVVLEDNFIFCDDGWLYLLKAMALSSPKMKDVRAESVVDLLETARRLMPPELIRRQVTASIFQALVHFSAGDYQQATEVALLALEKSQQIRSRLNKNRIESLYKQCLHTSYRDKPLLAYLGVKVRMWDYGTDRRD